MTTSSFIDMRTDTSSLPTDAMRQAMAQAQVGNDGLRLDPTVNRLEALAARLLDKQAALFVPSGCMGNLIALMAQAGQGRALLAGMYSHVQAHTSAPLAQFAGVMPIPIDDSGGGPDPDLVRALCRKAPASVLAIENTHNWCGGQVMPPARVAFYGELASELGLRLHMDAARLFNAAVALGLAPAQLVGPADSVMFCLSKSLCAPVGSMLVSDEATIDRARQLRKMLGGQMRQAGILAAAGIVALDQMVDRLAEDHAKARQLAAGIKSIPGLDVDSEPQTNLVMCRLVRPGGLSVRTFLARAQEAGVLGLAFGDDRVRLTCYRDISRQDVDRAVAALGKVMAEDRA